MESVDDHHHRSLVRVEMIPETIMKMFPRKGAAVTSAAASAVAAGEG